MAIKVLVVDDKPMIRRAIVTMMSWESWGCEVIADAEDGLAGKLAIDQYKPDIIVTDIRMPGMDGLSLAEYAGKVLPNCKVIVITGYDDFNYAKESIKLGIIEFLLKPLNDEEFSIAILRAVKQIKQKQHEMKEKEELLPSAKKQFITDRLYGISHSQDTSLLSKQLSSYRFVLLVLKIKMLLNGRH